MASTALEMGVLKIRRDLLEACMTCQICHKLVTDATAISECLHIFCKKCIFEKLADEEVSHCPVCNIDLGCNPFEKLRPDHNIQEIREKIFPSKKEKEDAGTLEVPSVPLPVRRKKRSLCSLVAETPRVASHGEVQAESSNSFATRRKTTQTRRQNNSDAESSIQASNEDRENEESYLDRPEQRTPVVEADQVSGPDTEVTISSVVARAQRLEGASQRRRELGTSAKEQLNQYCFSLVAAADLEEGSSLYQSPARYLRLTDGNLPVSSIQKYLARKLHIANESEVSFQFSS
ncbi:E3 ubiquitin protein ligase DRIP2-like [Phoenix dactylifera]|uniref:E3 ubiquitin protein ligase DRIP2-like n=1 Tax=Phoenix dactylifera TaxID=42345 RepID=A0A8B9AI88_PHODC|nr:E3 ubiquitin protein ligase DRIP2-like [Phoenix dactylifera]